VRPEAFGPRTWLLVAVAGWAALIALLSLLGLAGRITPMEDDPALVQALPKLSAPAPERLGPLSQYADIAARPLFSENRQPQPFYIGGKEDAAPAAPSFDWVLTSVLITPQAKLAILQTPQGGEGLRVKLGEEPAGQSGWRLAELQPRSAVFEGPGGRRTLELRVFDGTGGTPPTQVRSAGPPVAIPPGARVTGGPSAPTPAATNVPAPVPVPAPTPNQPPTDAPPAPPMSTEEQMDAIRKRIEARRAQMRQQQAQPTPPPPAPTPDKTQ
jgi:general secretion pathway protein N